MSNIGKFKTVFLYLASFAIVLEAVPQFYTERYDGPHHLPGNPGDFREARRFIREPRFDGYSVDDDAKFYEPIYDTPRYPRSGETQSNSVFVGVEPDLDFYDEMSAVPESVYRKPATPIVRYHPPTAGALYVVRSADPIVENRANGADFSLEKKSTRKFDPFPISMTRQDSALIDNARSLTDEELGKVVRKAIVAARHGESRNVVPTRRFSQSMIRGPALGDYRPRIGPTYADESALGDRPSDFRIEKGFRLDNDAVATIADETQESVEELHPDHAPDVSLSETEPEVYQFVDDVERTPEEAGDNAEDEGSSDDAIEGDVVLSVIEEYDGKDIGTEAEHGAKQNVDGGETESPILLEAEAPASTTEHYEIEGDSNLGIDDVDQRPPTTSEASTTDEPITDPSTTPGEKI